jgi:hypothetical protein
MSWNCKYWHHVAILSLHHEDRCSQVLWNIRKPFIVICPLWSSRSKLGCERVWPASVLTGGQNLGLEVCTGLGLALGLRPGLVQGPVVQIIFEFGLSWVAQITFKFRYDWVAQIIFGFGLFQILSIVIQNISALLGYFTIRKTLFTFAHNPWPARKYQHWVIWHCLYCKWEWYVGWGSSVGTREMVGHIYIDKLTSADVCSMIFRPCWPVVQCMMHDISHMIWTVTFLNNFNQVL